MRFGRQKAGQLDLQRRAPNRHRTRLSRRFRRPAENIFQRQDAKDRRANCKFEIADCNCGRLGELTLPRKPRRMPFGDTAD
jgi:hypothetical protein